MVNTAALLSQTISTTFPNQVVFETVVTESLVFTSIAYYGIATFSTPLSVTQVSTSTTNTHNVTQSIGDAHNKKCGPQFNATLFQIDDVSLSLVI